MKQIHCVLTGTTLDIPEEVFHLLSNLKTDLFKRRSRLYIPLISEEFLQNAHSTNADGLIFDLEDSVPAHQKESARQNISKIPPKKPGVEHILRINAYQTGLWKEDLKYLDHFPFDSVMIPKVESARHVEDISHQVSSAGLNRIVLIETIHGIWNIREIAGTLGERDAMGYGAGDLSTTFGISREPIQESMILQHILMQVLMAAKYVRADVFDPPYRDFTDMVTLREEAKFGRKCGTVGKQAVHPSQLEVINRVYSPTEAEIQSYVRELTGFAKQRDKQAIQIEGKYKGKPSKVLAEQKLCDYFRRGYISVIHHDDRSNVSKHEQASEPPGVPVK